MLHLIFRFIAFYGVYIFLLMLWSFSSPLRATVFHPDQGSAYLGAIACTELHNDTANSQNSPPITCEDGSPIGATYGYCPNAPRWGDWGTEYDGYTSTYKHPFGDVYDVGIHCDPYHAYPKDSQCDDQLPVHGAASSASASYCLDGCTFEHQTGVMACAGNPQLCIGDFQATGDACNFNGEITSPDGCSVNGDGTIVCDCVTNPAAPFCPGGDNPGNGDNCTTSPEGIVTCWDGPAPPGSDLPGPDDSEGDGPDLPGDDPTPPQDDPGQPGDGDVNTPGDGTPGGGDHPGTGDGDVDGDGDREIDCDPSSNPDCNYTGSGQGVGNCDSQPSCTGDPVQCAILYQQWATMCYDGGEFTNPGDCGAQFTCEGDVLKCEIIRQEREQYCALYVGEGGYDLDVTDDEDFYRDLKEEGEEIDLSNAIDDEGFAAGSCPADQTVQVMGASFGVPFTAMCDLATAIRPMVIIAAMLVGFMIIGGRR